MKIIFFALFFTCLLPLISVDRAVAAEASCDTLAVSSLSAVSVDPVTCRQRASSEDTTPVMQPSVYPSFSAHHRFLHQPSNTVLDEAQVWYSDAGLRVEQLIDQSGNGFIYNHAEEKIWFIDRQRQLVHTVPVIGKQNESKAFNHPIIDLSIGLIKQLPCVGLEARRGATELWQGRSVQHWTCLWKGQISEYQWYAPTLGVVVRTSTTDGYSSELTDIRVRETSSLNFQPPSHYRQVSIEELMNPAVPIGSYAE